MTSAIGTLFRSSALPLFLLCLLTSAARAQKVELLPAGGGPPQTLPPDAYTLQAGDSLKLTGPIEYDLGDGNGWQPVPAGQSVTLGPFQAGGGPIAVKSADARWDFSIQ